MTPHCCIGSTISNIVRDAHFPNLSNTYTGVYLTNDGILKLLTENRVDSVDTGRLSVCFVFDSVLFSALNRLTSNFNLATKKQHSF